MKEINIGGQTLRVRATALALLYYKQEFKEDLLANLMKMSKAAEDPTQIDTLSFMQLIWAMAKADSYNQQGGSFPSFEGWLSTIDSIDFADPTFLTAALEEATNGFFRTSNPGGK